MKTATSIPPQKKLGKEYDLPVFAPRMMLFNARRDKDFGPDASREEEYEKMIGALK